MGEGVPAAPLTAGTGAPGGGPGRPWLPATLPAKMIYPA
jgi:hypothetical protein